MLSALASPVASTGRTISRVSLEILPSPHSSNPTMNILNFNQQLVALDHLHAISSLLIERLKAVPGMHPFLGFAYNAAESAARQQAIALSQISHSADDPLIFSGSQTSRPPSIIDGNVFTFTLGVLPSAVAADPATQLWKLFQQGAPLCLLFNAIDPEHELPVVGSDDLKVCKKALYDFLCAAKIHLSIPDEEMFTISSIYSQSSDDLIKSINVVLKLLLMWKEGTTSPEGLTAQMLDLLVSGPNIDVVVTTNSSKVFKEIIETERKYVKDLELMAEYKHELQIAELLSSEQVHILFPMLSEVIGFQRRFLNGLECNINVPDQHQRIGLVFIHASFGPFRVYEPWTLGQMAALDLIQRELAIMRRSSLLLDPGFELQLYIIKPVQRICKYPLLLRELIKECEKEIAAAAALGERQEGSDGDALDSEANGWLQELKTAHIAVLEMAARVNEAQRRAENIDFVQQLHNRVTDWRGFTLSETGELLHHDQVGVRDGDVERDYVACLFEKIVFFFSEVTEHSMRPNFSLATLASPLTSHSKKKLLPSRKKPDRLVSLGLLSSTGLVNSIYPGGSSSHLLLDLSVAPPGLELKGRVYVAEITNVSRHDDPSHGGHTLIIAWAGKREIGTFTLKFRQDDIRNQWHDTLRSCKMSELKTDIDGKMAAALKRNLDASDSNILYPGFDVLGSYASDGNPYRILLSLSGSANGYEGYLARSSTSSSLRHHSTPVLGAHRQQGRVKLGGAFDSMHQRFSGPFAGLGGDGSRPPLESLMSAGVQVLIVYQLTTVPAPLILPNHATFSELFSKIGQHVSSSGFAEENVRINKIKYKDEDGDFVALDSDEDWTLAVDTWAEVQSADPDAELTQRPLILYVS